MCFRVSQFQARVQWRTKHIEGTPVENTLAFAVASAEAIAVWISCARAAATACALLLVAFATASAKACTTALRSVLSLHWHPSRGAAVLPCIWFILDLKVQPGQIHIDTEPPAEVIQTCLGSSLCGCCRSCTCICRSKPAACSKQYISHICVGTQCLQEGQGPVLCSTACGLPERPLNAECHLAPLFLRWPKHRQSLLLFPQPGPVFGPPLLRHLRRGPSAQSDH